MAEVEITRRGTAEPMVEHTGFRLSWGAVFAGLVVATALQIVLTLLGMAIGLSVVNPAQSAKGFGIGAAIWMIITTLISLYVGGLVTGRMAGVLTRRDGALHGILVWGLYTILAIYLVTSGISSLLGGAVQLASNAATVTAGTVARGGPAARRVDSAASSVARRAQSTMDTLQQSAGEVINETKGSVARGAWLALLGLALTAAAAALGAAQKAPE